MESHGKGCDKRNVSSLTLNIPANVLKLGRGIKLDNYCGEGGLIIIHPDTQSSIVPMPSRL